MTGTVYFVRAGADGPIKIGFSTAFDRRFRALHTSSPERLKVLARLPGDISLEREMHARFAAHRRNGEWFEPHPDLMDFIASVKTPDRPKSIWKERVPLDRETQRKSEILATCKTFLAGLAYPIGLDEKRSEVIERVAGVTGLSVRTIKSIWYGEAPDISAYTFLTIKEHFIRKFAKGIAPELRG